MKKKWLTAVTLLVVTLLLIWFISAQNRKAEIEKEEYQNMGEIPEAETEVVGNAEQDEELSSKNDMEEFWLKEEKIELTDYAELPIEEFIKETEIPFYQEEEGKWRTEDNTVWAKTANSKIISLVLSDYTGDTAKDEKLEKLIESKGFSYTIAGISLHDNVSYLENTVLKSASRVSSGGIGRDYYTSLDLSRLGIEKLTLEEIGETVGAVTVDFDMSLKESAEGLEYIWGERVRQKEGERNDRLVIPEDLYTEIPENYKQPGNIEKTLVSIKYPCLAIPGNPEMEQNANNLILETVERIEDKTYRKTDENMVVEADYFMTYITSRFISITFRVEVAHNGEGTLGSWQHCNINIAQNGEGATLADVGITREDVITACSASQVPVDIEGYLEKYDTMWSQFEISPIEYWLYVPALDSQPGEDLGVPIRVNKPRPE